MFDRVVKLYRLLGKPSFDEAYSFTVTVPKGRELLVELDVASNMDSSFGAFSYRDKGAELRVEGELPQNSDGHFFISVEDFIERTPSLNKGAFRDNFYVRDKDFSSTEGLDSCEDISNVARIVDFIKALRDFSAITLDDDQTLENGKLIFLKAADGKSHQQAAVLKVNILPSLASIKIKKYKILSEIKSAKERNALHIEERIILMNTAISDIISECADGDDKDFEYLVKNWDRVTKKYFHDLQAYMNGFSFDAVRKKISDSVMESTTKINNALGDIGTKILAVPVSVAGLVVLQESKNNVSFWFGWLGICIASIILHKTVNHYSDQLINLIKSFEFNLEVASLSKKSFGPVIRKELKRIDDFIVCQKNKISKTINLYRMAVWLPVLFSIGFIVNRYYDEFKSVYYSLKYCGVSFFWWEELTTCFSWLKF